MRPYSNGGASSVGRPGRPVVPHHVSATRGAIAWRAGAGHPQQLERSVHPLGEGGAALHPVAGIAVEDPLDAPHLRPVNVSAHHALEAPPGRLVRQPRFERRHEADGPLDLALDVRRQAPVRQPEDVPRLVEPPVEDEEHLVAHVTADRHPPVIEGDAVELVAVHDEEEAPVHRAMDGLPRHHDVPELEIAEPPEILVVVARHQRHRRARPGLRQDLADHVAMELGPVRGALQTPEVDDVADEVQELAFVPVEKVEQRRRLTARRAQVRVADPDGAVSDLFLHGVLLL